MKHRLIPILLLLLTWSCAENTKEQKDKPTRTKKQVKAINTDGEGIVKPALQTLLDTFNLTGCILIYDAQKQEYYSNNFEEAIKGALPASTFKIPNSIIGLETTILENEQTIFKWDGEERALPTWEKDLSLQEAFQVSCVPCYQELAGKIGLERMQSYLKQLDFGSMEVYPANLGTFWLVGNSKITPLEQISFLIRFYNEGLGISTATTTKVKNIMKRESNDQYTLSAKTGWAIREEQNTGWFVGYVEKNNDLYYFATRVNPSEEFDMNGFSTARVAVTKEALRRMGIVE